MMLSWPSPAKLNLFLYITGRSPETGYHQLQTLFQFIDYCDYLTFTPRQDEQINLLTPFANVAHDKNLIVVAARALQQLAYQQNKAKPLGVDITIDKRLPMGGGIGGASSNAATTLLALNYLWQTQLPKAELLKLAATLGADVPIFIHGHAAFAEGIGDQFQTVTYPEKWYLVVRPAIEVSTVEIFNDPNLKRDSVTRSLNELLNSPFSNDCEATVKLRYPQIAKLLTQLNQLAPTRLTGTGACIFAEFSSQAEAEAVLQSLPDNLEKFVAKGCNVSPLTTFMQQLA